MAAVASEQGFYQSTEIASDPEEQNINVEAYTKRASQRLSLAVRAVVSVLAAALLCGLIYRAEFVTAAANPSASEVLSETQASPMQSPNVMTDAIESTLSVKCPSPTHECGAPQNPWCCGQGEVTVTLTSCSTETAFCRNAAD
jgi:hypothetical protein